MLIKIVIIILFLLIILNMSFALFSMMKGKSNNKKTVKALTWRIALSLVLFIILVIAYLTGHIQPHGLIPVQ